MEAVVRNAQLSHEFERHVDATQSIVEGIRAVVPRTHQGRRTERVRTGSSERMPVADCETQPVIHRPTFNNFGRVIVSEGQRIAGGCPFKLDLVNFREVRSHSISLRDQNAVGWEKPGHSMTELSHKNKVRGILLSRETGSLAFFRAV